MDDESNAEGSGGGKVLRACDSCRTRKIRCDRASPCSNCRASKLVCQTTLQSQKVQRQRVHISDEYEKKIDRIEDRLGAIESALNNLTSKLGSLNLHGSGEQSRSNGTSRSLSHRSPSEMPVESPDKNFEGDTTMNTQSAFARDLLERAIGSAPSMQQNAQIKFALQSLQALVSKQDSMGGSEFKVFPRFKSKESDSLEPPPWEVVDEVLRRTAVSETITFEIIFPFLNVDRFRKYCREVCLNGNTTQGRSVLVYGILYNLLDEFCDYPIHGSFDKIQAPTYREYRALCKRNFETTIGDLDLLMPASMDNILALIIASSYAVDLCKPSLCWTLTGTAARMCQSLGYHRLSSMKDDSPEDRDLKMWAFWHVYGLDKTLSLRLGRASSIQDWDISIPRLEINNEASPHKSAGLVAYWVKQAEIAGQTYELLFSPAAFRKSETERVSIAMQLAQLLKEALQYRRKLGLRFSGFISDAGELFYRGDEVVYYSVMTLIQRALPPSPQSISSQFNNECILAARTALTTHKECASKFNTVEHAAYYAGYVHWTILQAPFTPFMVIFCHVITAYDSSDLQLLGTFVESLEASRSQSEGIDKLYRLCHVFYQVAMLYIEAKATETQAYRNDTIGYGGQLLDMSTMEQFDPYLSALGMVPNASWPMASMQTPTNQELAPNAASLASPNTLQDWFSGSRYMLGLMEEDLNMLQ